MSDDGRYYLDASGVTDLDHDAAYLDAIDRAIVAQLMAASWPTDYPTVNT